MAAAQAISIQDNKFSSLGLSKTVVNKEQICCYTRNLGSASDENPVFVLIHGYPQSSYLWRHFIPLLPESTPLFVPDLPGYGASPAISHNDKLTVGTAILSALGTELKRTGRHSSSASVPVILIGHDRGARVAHRLAVTNSPDFNILGVCLIDIVPTSTQWQHESSPAQAAQEVTGYFHWPFLANVDLATRMILAYGGDRWCTEMIERWCGPSPTSLLSLSSDNAMDVYGGFMHEKSVVKATCEDYWHGMKTDVEAQEEDQKQGRKIKVPLLLLYSESGIGKRYDFGTVWDAWVDQGVKITRHGLGGGAGHFGPEEAPEECGKAVGEWVKGLL